MESVQKTEDKTVDLSGFKNSWYQPGASRIKIICWLLFNAVFLQNSMNLSSSLKIFLLRIFGAKIGKNVLIKQSVNIKYPWNLSVGNNVWMGEKVWIDNLAKITIEANVCISQGAFLLTGNHDYKKPSFDLIVKEIKLEQGVWIGAKATVCPGVICKSHSVLSVGSVATDDLEPYSIYQGNPAVKVKERVIE